MPNCPTCQKEEAILHQIYGVMPGKNCTQKRAHNTLPDLLPEMVGASIQTQRKSHAKSIIQPYRSGQLSKEYIEAYGTKNIKVTPEEVKRAKPVWSDIHNADFDMTHTK